MESQSILNPYIQAIEINEIEKQKLEALKRRWEQAQTKKEVCIYYSNTVLFIIHYKEVVKKVKTTTSSQRTLSKFFIIGISLPLLLIIFLNSSESHPKG